MPLRLKSLELQGYKTFASKTTFEFAEGITAVVGPNGSGKSNIADALRWVLGEQSYNLLRGKKTEDMIFNGSEGRPRAGMAAASIVFDNTSGWLPVDFSEVALTRRAFRDGRNEYLINGQNVRLRDLNELLAQSGLSERTYTILGQGMVDASLALKSDERRRLFEEAAGIGLYRARREESLRRLETTKRNLERVLDILAELEPRLKSLERQAKRAQEYKQVQADLKLLLREWYGFHWHRSQSEFKEARQIAARQEARLSESRAGYQNLLAGFSESRGRLSELRARLNILNRQSAQLLMNREATSRELAVLEERQRALLESRQNALSEQQRLEDEVRLAAGRVAESEAEAARLKTELSDARAQEQNAKTALAARQLERAKVEQKLQSARQALNSLNNQKAQTQARLEELRQRIDGQKSRLGAADLAIAQAQTAAQQAAGRLAAAKAARAKAEEAQSQAEQALSALRQRLEQLETARRARLDERTAKAAEHARLKAQLDVLEQAEKSLSGVADGARTLLEAARQSRLSGARGALSAALDVPAELETAIAAALGDNLDAVILSGGQAAEAALALLDADSAGRATLLPLEWLQHDSRLKVISDPDCLGIAADLVKAPGEFQPAIALLLGRTLIARERSAARRLLHESGAQRVVTLRGEVFRADGSVQAGKENRGAALSRPRQRRELSQALEGIQADLATLNLGIEQLSADFASAQKEAAEAGQVLQGARRNASETVGAEQQANLASESARRQADWQAAQKETLRKDLAQAEGDRTRLALALEDVEEKLSEAHEAIRRVNGELAALDLEEFQRQVTFWNTRAQVAERAAAEAEKRLNERKQEAGRSELQRAVFARRAAEGEQAARALESEKSASFEKEKALNAQLEALRAEIDPSEQALEIAEKTETDLQAQELAAQKSLQIVERQNAQVQLDLTRKQEAIESLRRRVEDDFGLVQFEYEVPMDAAVPLPLGEMVQTLPVVTELPAGLEESLTQKKAQLRRMGAINMEAQSEYEQTLERFNNMSAQIEDLREAESDLRQVIAELDEKTRQAFTKTFDAVAARFREIFVRLFGGGSARLVLTDPGNLTETGIDIEAKLPGKREQGLSLLSGGERSLTAIALVFALLKVSPTPVCVMDEVDAMLDEANVGRFRDLLSELSAETQFVIITHNRNTVQAADVIYGITMGRDSASQMISLKLDEVTEEMLQRA